MMVLNSAGSPHGGDRKFYPPLHRQFAPREKEGSTPTPAKTMGPVPQTPRFFLLYSWDNRITQAARKRLDLDGHTLTIYEFEQSHAGGSHIKSWLVTMAMRVLSYTVHDHTLQLRGGAARPTPITPSLTFSNSFLLLLQMLTA
ncbi:hypothetical protein SUGI_0603580 [Cryptomeria japonica]|nr:hypothetical protein SUGI_0603580 [Cryptomeria japonica]